MKSVSAEGSEEAAWDVESWNELKKLADTTPAAGVWLQGMLTSEYSTQPLIEHLPDKTSYYRNEDLTQDGLHLWFKEMVPDVSLYSLQLFM